jgi:hypothetical protein
VLALRGYADRIKDVVVSPNGRQILTLAENEAARLWDAVTGKEAFTLPPSAPPGNYAGGFSPDNQRLLTCGKDGVVRLWDLAGRKELKRLSGPDGDPLHRDDHFVHAAFSPDGKSVMMQSAKAARLCALDLLAAARNRLPRVFTAAETSRFELDAVLSPKVQWLSYGDPCDQTMCNQRCLGVSGASADSRLEAPLTLRGMSEKGGRAVIINEAHGLRKDVIRQLLVTLERIPPHVVWVFTSFLIQGPSLTSNRTQSYMIAELGLTLTPALLKGVPPICNDTVFCPGRSKPASKTT